MKNRKLVVEGKEDGSFFYSKVLLFGEYALIEGSRGLATPFSRYRGKLEFNTKKVEDEKLSLYHFAHYLDKSPLVSEILETTRFIKT